MGKPAARSGDMTAHGGAITGPGVPTVLIGGIPAAALGDVCPMVTPGIQPILQVELFGLTSLLRRAGISIPVNIAEGFKKRSNPDKARFMNIAQGLLEECRYYCILSQDFGYGNSGHLLNNIDETGKSLDMYTQSILSFIS